MPDIDSSDTSALIEQGRLTDLLGFKLTRAELLIRRMFIERMRQVDLKPVDFSVLVLADANPGVNQRQVGEALNVSPPNLAIVVGRLVKRRLIRQVRGRQDRRMQHLHLTPQGVALLNEAESVVRQMESELQLALGKTQSRSLSKALDRLTHTQAP